MRNRLVSALGGAARLARRAGLASALHVGVRAADAGFAALGRAPIGVDVEGASIRGYLRHRSFLAEAARPRTTYAQLFLETLTPGATVVDGGAHVGLFTVLAAAHGAHVVAFEPDPYNLLALRLNAAGLPNVRLVEKALTDRVGTTTFHVTPSTIGSSVVERAGARAQVVETSSIDAELAGCAIDALVVKLNIEGAELQALEGARGTLARVERVTIFVEVNPPLLSAGGRGSADVETWLADAGFDVAYIDLPTQRPVPLPTPRRKGHLLATRQQPR
jgi:FkbM family methyltransferase